MVNLSDITGLKIFGLYRNRVYLVRQVDASRKYLSGYVQVLAEDKKIIDSTEGTDKYEKVDSHISMHGGCTWYEPIERGFGDTNITFIGFDCWHFEDMKKPKDVDYVELECERIIEQLCNLQKGETNERD